MSVGTPLAGKGRCCDLASGGRRTSHLEWSTRRPHTNTPPEGFVVWCVGQLSHTKEKVAGSNPSGGTSSVTTMVSEPGSAPQKDDYYKVTPRDRPKVKEVMTRCGTNTRGQTCRVVTM